MEVIVTYMLIITINWGGQLSQPIPPEPFVSSASCLVVAESLSEMLRADFPEIRPLVQFECQPIEPVAVPLVPVRELY